MKNFIKQQSANGLIFSRTTHLLIGKLANLLIFLLIFIACSKNDNDEPVAPPTTQVETPEHLKDWTPQPKVDTKQPYMAFATGSTSATTLTLTAVGATARSNSRHSRSRKAHDEAKNCQHDRGDRNEVVSAHRRISPPVGCGGTPGKLQARNPPFFPKSRHCCPHWAARRSTASRNTSPRCP